MTAVSRNLRYIVAGAIALLYCFVEAMGDGDLLIFLSAAGDVAKENIYYKSYQGGFHYFYSVLFALVLHPFYTLPYYGVKFCWLLLNLLMYVHLFRLLSKVSYVQRLEAAKRKWFLVIVFVFSFRFLHENIHASQITILILWCCVNSLRYFRQSKPLKGAALLAAGINIKLLPVVFLPYLLYRRYFIGFALTILIYAASLFLPSLIIGHEKNMELLESWWNVLNPVRQHHVLDVDERSFHGLSTLLSTLLVKEVPDIYALQLRRNIMDVSVDTLFAVLLTARLLIVLGSLFFLRWPPFARARNSWQEFTEISYLLLAIPLIFPHQQHYAFLFAVPAFACVLLHFMVESATMKKWKKRWMIAALVFIYLTASLRTILGEFNEYYEHYKILTYGALLLIPLLLRAARHPRPLTDS